MQVERRFSPHEVRLEQREDGPPKIVGHAAVFYREGVPGTEYRVGQWFTERVMDGAFDRAIKERQDVRALFNHDPNLVLGRTAAGTVSLRADKTGLLYEIEPGDTQVARDVLEHLRRGDVTGSSFAFRPVKSNWIETDDDEPDVREILDVDLYDVSPVTFPAYGGTDAQVRSDSEAVAEYQAWKQRRIDDAAWEMAARRRLVEIGEHATETVEAT